MYKATVYSKRLMLKIIKKLDLSKNLIRKKCSMFEAFSIFSILDNVCTKHNDTGICAHAIASFSQIPAS